MPVERGTPAYDSALEAFIQDVEKTMREKLSELGDFKNLAELETEIERVTLRMNLLAPDLEFQETVKRLDFRRQEIARKRDQLKPFLLKCERELALYRAMRAGAAAPQPQPAPQLQPQPQPIPQSVPQPQLQPVLQPQPVPQPQPQRAMPPMPVAPPMPPVPRPAAQPAPPAASAGLRPVPPAPPQPSVLGGWQAAPGPNGIDMSLPEEEPLPEGGIVAATTDFITGPGWSNVEPESSGDLLLEAIEVGTLSPAQAMPPQPPVQPPQPPPQAPAPPSAFPSAAAQWPPPGESIPDPFASFQPARPAQSPPVPRPAGPPPPGGKPPPWPK